MVKSLITVDEKTASPVLNLLRPGDFFLVNQPPHRGKNKDGSIGCSLSSNKGGQKDDQQIKGIVEG